MTDIDQIRLRVSLYDTVRSCGVDLEPDGREWVGCCPLHNERTPSFTLFAGKDGIWRFQCFGCGEHGDVIDFIEKVKGVSTAEAIKILGGEVKAGGNIAPPPQAASRDIYAGIEALDPVGEIIPGKRVAIYNPKRENTTAFAPSMVFPYRRADGSVMGYVLRHDLADGGKETPQVHWVRLPSGKTCWARFPFPKPRPLYGLDRLGDGGQVIVVEGEKCADALFNLRQRATVSWPGGTHGVRYVDWSPLRGRDVVIWPDADGPGFATATAIAEVLGGLADRVRFIDVIEGAGN